jgi:hypothetical protein
MVWYTFPLAPSKKRFSEETHSCIFMLTYNNSVGRWCRWLVSYIGHDRTVLLSMTAYITGI